MSKVSYDRQTSNLLSIPGTIYQPVLTNHLGVVLECQGTPGCWKFLSWNHDVITLQKGHRPTQLHGVEEKNLNGHAALMVHFSLVHSAPCQSSHGQSSIGQIPNIRHLFHLPSSSGSVHHQYHRCRSRDHLVISPQCRSRARRHNWDFRQVLHGH